MPVEPATLAALVDDVGRFHITDRAMRRAQDEMTQALKLGGSASNEVVDRYLDAVRRYFSGFEREARNNLADVDRRLAKTSQLQFNLTAERGVAQGRVEATQGVLARVLELARR